MDPTVAVTSIDLEGSKKNNLSKNKSEVSLMHNKLSASQYLSSNGFDF